MEVADRPSQLNGCWQTWTEKDVDVVLRTEMDSGAVHTRRRFSGRNRVATVSVTLPKDKYGIFHDWYLVVCRQGTIPTWMVTPYGGNEIWQFNGPPTITWVDKNIFRASCEIWQASYFEADP